MSQGLGELQTHEKGDEVENLRRVGRMARAVMSVSSPSETP
jgi:hypothetical protein